MIPKDSEYSTLNTELAKFCQFFGTFWNQMFWHSCWFKKIYHVTAGMHFDDAVSTGWCILHKLFLHKTNSKKKHLLFRDSFIMQSLIWLVPKKWTQHIRKQNINAWDITMRINFTAFPALKTLNRFWPVDGKF